jgi:hypothetical protein
MRIKSWFGDSPEIGHRLENEWDDAWVRSKIAFNEWIMTDDCTWTLPWDRVSTKTYNLALVKSGQDVVFSWVLDDFKIEKLGDILIL